MITAREDVGGLDALTNERARIMEYLVRHMHETLGETAGFLAETTDYVLSAPGKLLRPLLLFDACRAAGGNPDVVFPAAVGTEYGHIASLIHDDIIDGDIERRGQTTLHVKYNLGAAILTGDVLIFHTFLSYTECLDRGASPERVLDAIRTLSVTCIDISRGQALEAAIAGDLSTPVETYLEVIRLKTAAFCSAAARIGAQLGDASEEGIAALSQYGHNIGMAFQIMDDILAYEGNATLMGKPLASDVRNRRVTLPIIFAMQSRRPGVREQITEIFTSTSEDDLEAHKQLIRVLQAARALDRARALAYRYTVKAKQQLDLLPHSEARERLRALADIFLARNH